MKVPVLPPGATTPIAPVPATADAAPLLPITAAWRLDVAGQRLVGPAGEVLLPALEFRLLLVFRRHPHRVFSRDHLLDLAWEPAFEGTDRAVDRAVYRLRHLLEPNPARPRYLRTRRGAGYSYCPPPSVP